MHTFTCVYYNEGAAPMEAEVVARPVLVRIHFIIVMIRWTGLAPWEFELGPHPWKKSLLRALFSLPPTRR